MISTSNIRGFHSNLIWFTFFCILYAPSHSMLEASYSHIFQTFNWGKFEGWCLIVSSDLSFIPFHIVKLPGNTSSVETGIHQLPGLLFSVFTFLCHQVDDCDRNRPLLNCVMERTVLPWTTTIPGPRKHLQWSPFPFGQSLWAVRTKG